MMKNCQGCGLSLDEHTKSSDTAKVEFCVYCVNSIETRKTQSIVRLSIINFWQGLSKTNHEEGSPDLISDDKG